MTTNWIRDSLDTNYAANIWVANAGNADNDTPDSTSITGTAPNIEACVISNNIYPGQSDGVFLTLLEVLLLI